MKNNLKLIILSVSLFLACEKEVELKIDENDSKLVLNAWLKTDRHPLVEVNRSTFIFDKRGTDHIDNAEVILFENDQEIGYLEYFQSGYYQNKNIKIKPDTEYKIMARVDGFEEITAIEKAASKITDEDYEFEFNSIERNNQFGGEKRSEINLTINDNASTEDFYLFRLKATSTEWNTDQPEEDTTYNEYYEYVEVTDLQTEELYLDGTGSIQVLKDELFNGQEYTVRFNSHDLRKDIYVNGSYNAIFQYKVEMHKISKSLYLYLKSVENNRYPDPFTEPTQIFSNVVNGYGILATSTVVEIPIEELGEVEINE
jgi:hypothetical protein